mgnify:FL=1
MEYRRTDLLSDRLEKKISTWQLAYQKTLDQRLTLGILFVSALIAAAIFRNLIVLQFFAFLVFPAAFIFCTRKSTNISKFVKNLTLLNEFFKRQNSRKAGLAIENGKAHLLKVPSPFNEDLDLFHFHGAFNQLDETLTSKGRDKLAAWMTANETDAAEIQKRQRIVKALAQQHWQVTRLILIGRNSANTESAQLHLEDFAHRPFLEPSFNRDLKILLFLFTLSIIGFLQAINLNLWNPALFPLLHFFYFLYSSAQLKASLSRAQDLEIQLGHLIPILRKLELFSLPEFAQDLLKNIKKMAPSKQLKSLGFISSALSVQAHPVVYFVLNGLLPWSFFFTHLLERQRCKLKSVIGPCLDEVATFEAYMSLALVYKYQSQTMPQLNDSPSFSTTGLRHPLIDQSRAVTNDFTLRENTHLNLITGSNMAGKSTFLRTVGVNHVLMQMGAPVFARTYHTFPFKLATCIRVSDSLENGFSYFYSEVIRLKEIIDLATKPEPTLYLIDEIFRGTNNRERLEGSKALLNVLSKTHGIGFVSTHDLELTQLANGNNLIDNFHFRDDIQGDELVFSYKIIHGPCPTTNALKLMAKAGLPVQY